MYIHYIVQIFIYFTHCKRFLIKLTNVEKFLEYIFCKEDK